MGRLRGVGLRLQGTALQQVREGEEDQRHNLVRMGKDSEGGVKGL